MWHASVSLQHRNSGPVADEAYVEAQAVLALRGVGGPCEWWLYSAARVGHLRVPVTLPEFELMPESTVVDDAGETGPLRPRTP